MAGVGGFEDLKVWQASRALNGVIFKVIIDNDNIQDYSLKNQINRLAGSVMDNIAEGYERQGNKEFKQYLAISRGSCGEVKSQLYRAYDRKYINEELFKEMLNKTKEISKMLNSFIKYLVNSELKGSKYIQEPSTPYITQDPNIKL